METLLMAEAKYAEMQRELQSPQAPRTPETPRTSSLDRAMQIVGSPLMRMTVALVALGSVQLSVVSAEASYSDQTSVRGGDDTGNRNKDHDKNEKNDRNEREQRKHERKKGNGNDNNDGTEVDTSSALRKCVTLMHQRYDGREYAPGRLNVGFNDTVNMGEAAKAAQRQDLDVVSRDLYRQTRVLTLSGNPGEEFRDICKMLIDESSSVRFAEPDFLVRTHPTGPNSNR